MFNINPENYKSENILSEEDLVKKLDELRKEGKKIGLCTGSFDLLHPGHITHLESAKKMCDVLVVAVARDHYSSKKRNGKGRPVFSHHLRAFMVSKLKTVDFVVFEDGTVDNILRIKPDIYIKGNDYSDETDSGVMKGKKITAVYGGKTCFTKDEKLSTTDIIKYIKEEII